MIPILYTQDEKQFNHLGLGALSEAITCVATEERNGLFELEITYPIDGTLYHEIMTERIIVADASPLLPNQRFVIHRITKPKNGIIKIYAEHVSQYKTKNNSIKAKVSFSGNAQIALNTWNENLLYDSGFTVFSDIGTESQGEWTIEKATDARKVLGGMQGSILDRYGGEYLFDNDHISLLEERGTNKGVRIAYGKNLVDVTQEEEITNTVTSIQPFVLIFKNDGTEDDILTLPEEVIHSENVENFAHPKIMVHNFSGEEITTVEQLRKRTEQFIEENQIGTPKVNIKINFIDLSKTVEYAEFAKYEALNLCDEVLIDYTDLGINGIKGKVVKTTYNSLLDVYNEIEVGDTRYTYSNSLSAITDKIEETETLNRAWLDDLRSSIINDYFNQDSYNYDLKVGNVYGLPSGYYSFDAPVEQNPTRVIYIGGGIMAIANSKTTDGNWNWKTIATGDGFYADKMFADTITANLVKSGILMSENGETWIDMDNGQFNFLDRLTLDGNNELKMNGHLFSKSGYREIQMTYGQFMIYDHQEKGELFNITALKKASESVQSNEVFIVKGEKCPSLWIAKSSKSPMIDGHYLEFRSEATREVIRAYQEFEFVKKCKFYEECEFLKGLSTYRITDNQGNQRIYLQDGTAANIFFDGNIQAHNDLTVLGAKNAAVETEHYGTRALPAYETAEYYFGDIGTGATKDGAAKIEIEKIFKEVVNTEIEYQVFIQAYGAGQIWVSERTKDYFIVESTEDMDFAWELKAKRKKYENSRLEKVELEQNEQVKEGGSDDA